MAALQVLFEDNHLLVLDKPAGCATMGTQGEGSLWNQAKVYLKQKYQKPGNVYLGVVSRLDSLVSGVVVFARTSKAADRLCRMFRERDVSKTYWAVVAGSPHPATGEWTDWMAPHPNLPRMAVAGPQAEGAKEARLKYRTLHITPKGTALEFELITGRKHQIRVQCAHHGHAVLGDRKYGSSVPFSSGIALHARRLALEHPVRHEPLEFIAPLPPSWQPLRFEP